MCRNWDPFKTDYIFQSSDCRLDQREGDSWALRPSMEDRPRLADEVYFTQGWQYYFCSIKLYEGALAPENFSLSPSSIKLVTSKTIYTFIRPVPILNLRNLHQSIFIRPLTSSRCSGLWVPASCWSSVMAPSFHFVWRLRTEICVIFIIIRWPSLFKPLAMSQVSCTRGGGRAGVS